MAEDHPNDAPQFQGHTRQTRRKRWLTSLCVLALIALPVSGFVMVAIDRVQDASDRAT